MHIKNILQTYEIHSGQSINLQKSSICCNSNVRTNKHVEIKNLLGVHKDLSNYLYLGLPSLVGRSKKSIFSFLKDRI